MASTKEYRDFVLGQFDLVPGLAGRISCRSMMGEFLLYSDGILFGGIYDDRLLVKKVAGNERFGMSEAVPYKGAKVMWFVECVDDPGLLAEIVEVTVRGCGVGD